MEQTDPRRRTSARLAFADHVDYLVAGQRAPGRPKRTETLAEWDNPLWVACRKKNGRRDQRLRRIFT